MCGVRPQTGHYPHRDDVTRAVDDWEASVHQHLPHQLDIALVLAAEGAPLGTLQDPHRLQGSSQQHGRQGGGENKASSVGPYGVDQQTCAGDVPSDTAERLTWEEEELLGWQQQHGRQEAPQTLWPSPG